MGSDITKHFKINRFLTALQPNVERETRNIVGRKEV
jgi:hypothetical protein